MSSNPDWREHFLIFHITYLWLWLSDYIGMAKCQWSFWLYYKPSLSIKTARHSWYRKEVPCWDQKKTKKFEKSFALTFPSSKLPYKIALKICFSIGFFSSLLSFLPGTQRPLAMSACNLRLNKPRSCSWRLMEVSTIIHKKPQLFLSLSKINSNYGLSVSRPCVMEQWYFTERRNKD